jgi:trimeric autotransporter adhesin
MKHPFPSNPGVFAQRRRFFLALTLLSTGWTTTLHAQNTSEDADNIPLPGGVQNAAFGIGVLSVNAGNFNVGLGYRAATSNSTGNENVAVGYFSLANNTTGNYNTAVGTQALELGVTPSFNTALGYNVLRNANGASQNTAAGHQAMLATTTGGRNAAFGMRALTSNTVGSHNTAIGPFALTLNTAGYNTALGSQSMMNNATGFNNVAAGFQAMFSNTTGYHNTVSGYQAFYANSTGVKNAAFGSNALQNSNGDENSGFGRETLFNTTIGGCNTAVGSQSLNLNTIGACNSALGCYSNVSVGNLTNATAIGCGAVSNATNKIRLGNAAVSVIEGQVAYTFPSDGRFKTNVRTEDVVGLEFIQRLRPVVYNFETRRFTEFLTQNMPDSLRQRYLATDFGPSTAIRQSGFIAQEVEQAAREVGYDFNGVHVPADAGDNYSVAYSQFVVPLVKAVQEQQAMIATQSEQIALQQKELAELKSLVRTLAQAGEGDASKQAHAVEVFPNPSQGRFTVRIAPLEQGHWEVFDQQGKQVHFRAVTPDQSEYSLDLSGLASGSYLLRLHSPGGLVATKQLVVK